MVAPSRIKSIETGSGIAWEEWLLVLEPYKEASHTEIARFALAFIEARGASASPGWWAQGVAVAYEQHIGRRKPGQTTDGSFNVTVSKTLPGDMDEVLRFWVAKMEGVRELNGSKILGEPRLSRTEKWRYWRCNLGDKSVVSVNIQTKASGDTSMIAVNHDKLPNEEAVEGAHLFWKQVLAS